MERGDGGSDRVARPAQGPASQPSQGGGTPRPLQPHGASAPASAPDVAADLDTTRLVELHAKEAEVQQLREHALRALEAKVRCQPLQLWPRR